MLVEIGAEVYELPPPPPEEVAVETGWPVASEMVSLGCVKVYVVGAVGVSDVPSSVAPTPDEGLKAFDMVVAAVTGGAVFVAVICPPVSTVVPARLPVTESALVGTSGVAFPPNKLVVVLDCPVGAGSVDGIVITL